MANDNHLRSVTCYNVTILSAQYSSKGKHGFNPIVKYGVLTYANMRGVREIDRIVELCKKDLAFIWLTQGEQPKRDSLYHRYNALLEEYGYDEKYGLGHALMFIIEGMDKVREVIEKNRKRKLTKHKKLSNNRIIEIDNPYVKPKKSDTDRICEIMNSLIIGWVSFFYILNIVI